MMQTIEDLMLSIQQSRISTNNAEWDKFYTVYSFDEIKYHKLCKQYPNSDRTQLKQQCYVLDESGKRQYLGDENHIFRISVLHNIQNELSKYCVDKRKYLDYWQKDSSTSYKADYYTLYYERYDKGVYVFEGKEYKILNPHDYYEVELNNTWQLPIKQRVLLHLKVLKMCRNGMSLEEASKLCQQKNN